MGSAALRAATLLLIGSTIMIVFAVMVGRQIETSTVTDYTQINGTVYTIRIRDIRSTTSINLAGSRCFAAPPLDPEWTAVRQQYESNYMQQLEVRSFDAQDAVNRLRCP